MDISALTAALAVTPKIEKAAPAQQAEQLEAFMRHLFPATSGLPEQAIVSDLQQGQQQLVKGLEQAEITDTLTPETSLAAQAGLANSVVSIDFVAKVAGSFSQAINKLVSMQ